MLNKNYYLDEKSSYRLAPEDTFFYGYTFFIYKSLENIIKNKYKKEDIMIDIAKYLIRDILPKRKEKEDTIYFDFSYNGVTVKKFALIHTQDEEYLILHERLCKESHLKDVGSLYT